MKIIIKGTTLNKLYLTLTAMLVGKEPFTLQWLAERLEFFYTNTGLSKTKENGGNLISSLRTRLFEDVEAGRVEKIATDIYRIIKL